MIEVHSLDGLDLSNNSKSRAFKVRGEKFVFIKTPQSQSLEYLIVENKTLVGIQKSPLKIMGSHPLPKNLDYSGGGFDPFTGNIKINVNKGGSENVVYVWDVGTRKISKDADSKHKIWNSHFSNGGILLKNKDFYVGKMSCLESPIHFDESVSSQYGPFEVNKISLLERIFGEGGAISPADFVEGVLEINEGQFDLIDDAFKAVWFIPLENALVGKIKKRLLLLSEVYKIHGTAEYRNNFWNEISALRKKHKYSFSSLEEVKKFLFWNKFTVPSEYGYFLLVDLFRELMDQFKPKSVYKLLKDYVEFQTKAAKEYSIFKGVFDSKIYYAILSSFERDLGISDRTLIDPAFSRNFGNVSIFTLSNKVIVGGTRSKFGFYYKETEVSSGKSGYDYVDRISTKIADETFLTHVKVKSLGPIDHLISREKRPDGSQLWRDGVLSGAVLFGSNMEVSEDKLFMAYQSYLDWEEFSFRLLEKDVDTLDFLENKIVGGELDYLVKEAHSDSDDQNLLRVHRRSNVWIAEKNSSKGREVIFLFSKGNSSVRTDLISNKEFGRWMKKRKEDKGTKFYYMNTSCSSYSKAVNEYESILEASDNVVILASSGTANLLGMGGKNHLKHLLNSFRRGDSYETTRKPFGWNEKRNRSKFEYMFPDEEEYHDRITKILTGPLDVSIRTFDSSGREVFVDEINSKGLDASLGVDEIPTN